MGQLHFVQRPRGRPCRQGQPGNQLPPLDTWLVAHTGFMLLKRLAPSLDGQRQQKETASPGCIIWHGAAPARHAALGQQRAPGGDFSVGATVALIGARAPNAPPPPPPPPTFASSGYTVQ